MGAALLVTAPFTACRYSTPAETVCALPDKAGGNAFTFATRCRAALKEYFLDYDRAPHSIRDLCPRYLPAESLIPTCPEGTVQERTVMDYRRHNDEGCLVEIRHYLRDSALRSTQKIEIPGPRV
jgi:hypothetical protein